MIQHLQEEFVRDVFRNVSLGELLDGFLRLFHVGQVLGRVWVGDLGQFLVQGVDVVDDQSLEVEPQGSVFGQSFHDLPVHLDVHLEFTSSSER